MQDHGVSKTPGLAVAPWFPAPRLGCHLPPFLKIPNIPRKGRAGSGNSEGVRCGASVVSNNRAFRPLPADCRSLAVFLALPRRLQEAMRGAGLQAVALWPCSGRRGLSGASFPPAQLPLPCPATRTERRLLGRRPPGFNRAALFAAASRRGMKFLLSLAVTMDLAGAARSAVQVVMGSEPWPSANGVSGGHARYARRRPPITDIPLGEFCEC